MCIWVGSRDVLDDFLVDFVLSLDGLGADAQLFIRGFDLSETIFTIYLSM